MSNPEDFITQLAQYHQAIHDNRSLSVDEEQFVDLIPGEYVKKIIKDENGNNKVVETRFKFIGGKEEGGVGIYDYETTHGGRTQKSHLTIDYKTGKFKLEIDVVSAYPTGVFLDDGKKVVL